MNEEVIENNKNGVSINKSSSKAIKFADDRAIVDKSISRNGKKEKKKKLTAEYKKINTKINANKTKPR